MTALLKIDKVTRRFGGLTAVDEVSTSIAQGEVRGVIGPNGAGKTTLINLISGLFLPTSGAIELDGENITNVPAHRRAMLQVRRTFQNLKLFDGMSALHNVLIGLHLRGCSGVIGAIAANPATMREEATLRAEAQAALDLVGLSAYADVDASSLSYGHKKLLEIARAISTKPKLLLLDEPAAGLNPTEALAVTGLIHQINASGITIVLVEHRMDVIMNACSRITVLNYGRMLAEGTPGEIQGNDKVIEAYLGLAGLEERLATYA